MTLRVAPHFRSMKERSMFLAYGKSEAVLGQPLNVRRLTTVLLGRKNLHRPRVVDTILNYTNV
jgi:hypothetical protein